MRTVTTTKTVYLFGELDEKAQEKAIERESMAQGEMFDHECTYEDAATIGEVLGIDLRTQPRKLRNGETRYDPNIYYSGFSSQGDGACFEGSYRYAKGSCKAIRAYAPEDKELHRIADELFELQRRFFYRLSATTRQRGHYNHSGCMEVEVRYGDGDYNDDRALPEDELARLLRDFADWIYKRLNDEYDYVTSEETCRAYLTESDDEFTEDGARA